MDFELKNLDLAGAAREKADAIVVVVPPDWRPGRDPISRLAADALQSQALDRKNGKPLACWRPDGVACPRVVLVGSGGDATPAGWRKLKSAVAAAVAGLRDAGVRRLLVCLPGATSGDVRSAVMAVRETTYVYTETRSKAEGRALRKAVIAVADAPAVRESFREAVATAMGIELARGLGDMPPNFATPTRLALEARRIARSPGIRCQVLGASQIRKLGMGAFLGVARGSREEPKFIILHYTGAPAAEAPVVLVGKGITFDSGGISIKPAADMDEMKFDMSGAGSVLGTFRALAELRPRVNVVGLIPACENLPDGLALKPGDVLETLSGQTVEVLNTDAEGRLILCDALTYAKRFKPRAVIDIATLTGACVVALGAVRSGLFSNDDPLALALQEAGEACLDPCWRMPLDDAYGDGLRSHFADMANVAGRMAGAVTAAKFLQRFVSDDTPWAHLDIAGTAWRGGAAKGSTGRPVGLLVHYLVQQARPARTAARKATRQMAATPTRGGRPARKAAR
jgi:leucyl aminopeptidase